MNQTTVEGRIQFKPLLILILVLVVDLLSFTCILPLLPSIFDYYAVSKEQDWLYTQFKWFGSAFQQLIGVPVSERYKNVLFAGIIGSLFSLLQYLSSPIFGALSDVHGRKPILIISVFGSLISYWIWSISTNFTLFTLSRVIGGFSKASVGIGIAVITDVCPVAKRGVGMSFIGIAFSLAFMFGPIIGASFMSADQNINVQPARFAMLLTIVELIVILFALPETLPPEKRLKRLASKSIGDYIWPGYLLSFKVLDKNRSDEIRALGRIYVTYLLLYSAFEFTISFLTHSRFNYSSADQGKMYFVTGVLMTLIQGAILRKIPVRRQRNGALFGLAIIVPAYLLLSVAFVPSTLYASLVLYAISSSLVVPCLTTLVSRECSENEKGAGMGVLRSLGALARAVGPLIGSTLFWLLGPTSAYLIGGTLLIIPCYLLYKLPEKVKTG